MANETQSNQSVQPAHIGKAFVDLQDDLRASEVEFSTVSNNNVIILHSPSTSRTVLQDLVTTFTEVHPSRFFVICLDDQTESIEAYVSAVCQSLGQQKVCSEIVKATIPVGALKRFPSILRANLISGRTTEVFIADERAGLELFPIVAQTADYVFFDSRSFPSGLHTVKKISDMFPKVVDLEWLRLSPWRSAVRNIFERSSVLAHLHDLHEIEIISGGQTKNDPSAVLMGSWILNRLKMHVHAVTRDSVEARGAKPLKIAFSQKDSDKSGILSLTFHFKGCKEFSRIRMSIENGIITDVDSKPPLHTFRPIEGDSSQELIKRFYLVGESVTNFSPSLKIALKILEASQ